MGKKPKRRKELSVVVSASLTPDGVRKLERLMIDRNQGRSAVVADAIDCLYELAYPTDTQSNQPAESGL